MKSNPIYNSKIHGSSSEGGTLTLSGSPAATKGDVFVNPDGGKTGIGTSNPSNTLSVRGDADVSGKLGVGTTSPSNPLSVSGDADISGKLSVGTISPANTLSVSGDVDVSGTLSVSRNTTLGCNATPSTSLLVTSNKTGGVGIHWNLTGAAGESDFVNFNPGTHEAFNFYSIKMPATDNYTLPNPLPAPVFTIGSSGNVSVTKNLINNGRTSCLSNWGESPNPNFGLENGVLCSSGGLSAGGLSGFGRTRGGGNYSHYAFDLGESYSGYISVDMVLCKENKDDGLWNIIVSSEAVTDFEKSNNQLVTWKFHTDPTAKQIWNQYQDISNGQLFNSSSPYIMPVQATAYFNNARSFYIGAVDLGNGEIGIKINSISVTPLILS